MQLTIGCAKNIESPARILSVPIEECNITYGKTQPAPFGAFPPISTAFLKIPPITGSRSMCILDFVEARGTAPAYVT